MLHIHLDKSIEVDKQFVIFSRAQKMWIAEKGFTTSKHYARKFSIEKAREKVKKNTDLVIESY